MADSQPGNNQKFSLRSPTARIKPISLRSTSLEIKFWTSGKIKKVAAAISVLALCYLGCRVWRGGLPFSFFSPVQPPPVSIPKTHLMLGNAAVTLGVACVIGVAARILGTAMIPRDRMRTAFNNRLWRSSEPVYDFTGKYPPAPEGWVPPWWSKKSD